jgi:hypothetical protein
MIKIKYKNQGGGGKETDEEGRRSKMAILIC